MATSKLAIYSAALRLCGERRLASLAEDRKPRHLLDSAWDNDGVLTCLEMGQWRFAMRAMELVYSSDFDPPFGYTYAFEKPEDLVRIAAVCSDERFNVPLTQYFDEGDYWFADLQTLYIRYVSDDNEFGMDFAKWPPSFTRYVEAYFASQIVVDLTSDEKKRAEILAPNVGLLDRRLKTARANDAMKDPTRFAPPGSWVSARGSGRGNDPSGGQLIG